MALCSDARRRSTIRTGRESRGALLAILTSRSSSPSRRRQSTNIMACIHEGVPVVVGTTGWYDSLPMITEHANAESGAFFGHRTFQSA